MKQPIVKSIVYFCCENGMQASTLSYLRNLVNYGSDISMIDKNLDRLGRIGHYSAHQIRPSLDHYHDFLKRHARVGPLYIRVTIDRQILLLLAASHADRQRLKLTMTENEKRRKEDASDSIGWPRSG
jgi:hypothetical protein